MQLKNSRQFAPLSPSPALHLLPRRLRTVAPRRTPSPLLSPPPRLLGAGAGVLDAAGLREALLLGQTVCWARDRGTPRMQVPSGVASVPRGLAV